MQNIYESEKKSFLKFNNKGGGENCVTIYYINFLVQINFDAYIKYVPIKP